MPDNIVEYNVELPGCGHLYAVKLRAHESLADYNARLVPELREAVKDAECVQCAQEKVEIARQKLVEEMNAKVKE